MAERLKAHVLKTCLVKANVGSNPTPSALRFQIDDFGFAITIAIVNRQFHNRKLIWGGARVAEWARLLSECRAKIRSRVRIPPSPLETHPQGCVFVFRSRAPIEGKIFESRPLR